MTQVLDSIYLNKRGHPKNDGHWAYYRVTSWGKDGDDIQVCMVQWPTFKVELQQKSLRSR